MGMVIRNSSKLPSYCRWKAEILTLLFRIKKKKKETKWMRRTGKRCQNWIEKLGDANEFSGECLLFARSFYSRAKERYTYETNLLLKWRWKYMCVRYEPMSGVQARLELIIIIICKWNKEFIGEKWK